MGCGENDVGTASGEGSCKLVDRPSNVTVPPIRKLAAILSSDVAGYSRLMSEDDRGALEAIAATRKLMAARIAEHGGRVVDAIGDALLADFQSAVESVRCAAAIQREIAKRNSQLPQPRRMMLRIGINLGDVLEEGGALYGDGVNVAARLEGLAERGGVCVSGAVFDQVEGKLPWVFRFGGEQAVKNIAKPVRTYHLGTKPPAQPRAVGPLIVNPAERQVIRGGAPEPIDEAAFDVLECLVEAGGRVVSRLELHEIAAADQTADEAGLQEILTRLRALAGGDAIETVPGRGYRLAASIAETVSTPVYKASDRSALPPPPGALVGRDADVEAVQSLVREHRLVTITGPGGIGKTRLAQAAAHAACASFPGGVRWIELAAVNDAALVPSAIAIGFGVALEVGRDPLAAAAAQVGMQETLILLDNVEHVIDAAHAAVAQLVAQTPFLRVIATSQAPLKLSDEAVYKLGSLSVPPSGTPVAEALTHGAVALFAARAKATDRRFALTDANVVTVIEICRRLDGIPLALELAAARWHLVGGAALARMLEHRLSAFAARNPDVPPRQRTLEAAHDWSCQLLGEGERRLLAQLALFTDDFTLDEACEAAGEEGVSSWVTIDRLAELVDRSLIAASETDPPRYSLLESTRAYGMVRLGAANDQRAVRRVAGLYERRGDAATVSASVEAMRAFGTSLALTGRLSSGPERERLELTLLLKLGPELQAILGPAHPRCEEAYRRAGELAAAREPDEEAFKALWGIWHSRCMAGQDREAARYAQDILQLATSLGETSLLLEAHHACLTTDQLLGNASAVVKHARRVIALYERDRHHALAFSFGGHDPGICALGQCAVGLWLTGDSAGSLEMARKAIALAETIEHGYSRAVAYYYSALAYCMAGRREDFANSAATLVGLCRNHGLEMLGVEGRLLAGRARFEAGDGEGVAQMREALDTIEAGGDFAFAIFYAALLADALVEQGALEEALRVVTRAERFAAAGQGFYLPEILRLRGEIRLSQGMRDAARRDFEEAAALAAKGEAASLEQKARARLSSQFQA